MSIPVQVTLDLSKLSYSDKQELRRLSLDFSRSVSLQDNVFTILNDINYAREAGLIAIVDVDCNNLYDEHSPNLKLLLEGRVYNYKKDGEQVLAPYTDERFLETLIYEAVKALAKAKNLLKKNAKGIKYDRYLVNANVRYLYLEHIFLHIERHGIDLNFDPVQKLIQQQGWKIEYEGIAIDNIIQMPRRGMRQAAANTCEHRTPQ